jgi:hypothetical protein
MASSRKRKPKSFTVEPVTIVEWMSSALFLGWVQDGSRKLAVSVQPKPPLGDWGVTAVEVSAAASSVADVYNDHSHAHVGDYPNAKAAFEAAETYAAHWLKHRREGKRCDCGDINVP